MQTAAQKIGMVYGNRGVRAGIIRANSELYEQYMSVVDSIIIPAMVIFECDNHLSHNMHLVGAVVVSCPYPQHALVDFHFS